MVSNSVKNIFSLPAAIPQKELFEKLASGPGIQVERILSYGQTTPADFWHDQEKDEWLVLLQGKATLLFEGEGSLELNGGDSIMIPRHQRHQVTSTSIAPPCIWLTVHAALDLE